MTLNHDSKPIFPYHEFTPYKPNRLTNEPQNPYYYRSDNDSWGREHKNAITRKINRDNFVGENRIQMKNTLKASMQVTKEPVKTQTHKRVVDVASVTDWHVKSKAPVIRLPRRKNQKSQHPVKYRDAFPMYVPLKQVS